MARSHNRKRATPRVGDGAQIITIHIPAENGAVALHAHLAAYYSDYFRAALSLPEGSGMWRLLLAFHARRLGDDPAARHDGYGPAAVAAGGGEEEEEAEAWSAAALRELNRSLAAQLAAARSCVRKLDDAGYVGAAMRAEIEAVLGTGSLDPKQYLEADGSR